MVLHYGNNLLSVGKWGKMNYFLQACSDPWAARVGGDGRVFLQSKWSVERRGLLGKLGLWLFPQLQDYCSEAQIFLALMEKGMFLKSFLRWCQCKGHRSHTSYRATGVRVTWCEVLVLADTELLTLAFSKAARAIGGWVGRAELSSGIVLVLHPYIPAGSIDLLIYSRDTKDSLAHSFCIAQECFPYLIFGVRNTNWNSCSYVLWTMSQRNKST